MKQEKIEKLYRLAMSAYAVCDYEDAIRIFKSLLSCDLSHAPAHFYLGVSYQKTQEYERSLEHFNACKTLGFHELGLYKCMALSYRKIGLYKEANFYLQKHLKKSREDHETYAHMADNYLLLNQIHHSVSVMRQAIVLEPKTAEYHLKLAKLYKHEHNFDAALKEITIALALEPRNWEAYFIGATLYVSLGVHDKAIKYYQKSIELNNTNAMSYNNLAVSLLELGELDKAYKMMGKAVKRSKNNRNFLKNLHMIEDRFQSQHRI